jgi:hypothetical protein
MMTYKGLMTFAMAYKELSLVSYVSFDLGDGHFCDHSSTTMLYLP